MYLEQLHYLEILGQYPSISQAATALFISQPALSRAINKLEAELDLKLLQRTNNGFTLTDDGKAISQYASKISTEISNIYSYASKQNTQDRVCFTAIPGLCDTLVIEALANFKNKYPKKKVIFNFSPTEMIIQELKKDEIDFALLSVFRGLSGEQELPINDAFDVSLLFSDNILYWMRADHPLAKADVISDEDNDFIYSVGTNFGHTTASTGVDMIPSNTVISTSVGLYKSLIQQYDAIIPLPRLLTYRDPDIESGKIITKPSGIPVFIDYYFIKRKNKYLSKATDDFINIFLMLLTTYQEQIQ